MSQRTSQPAIQLALIAVCVIFVTITRSPSVNSQFSSCVEPPHYLGYPPPKQSWPQNAVIAVKIDDDWTAQSDRDALKEGIEKWNDALNCSGVQFNDFSTQNFTEYSSTVPNNTLYVARKPGSNTSISLFFWNTLHLRVKSARVNISSNEVNTFSSTYFIYLGTHEVGHAFGLDNCICANCSCVGEKSIMGGHSSTNPGFNAGGPTVCDNSSVDDSYCPGPCTEYCDEEDINCIPGDNCTYPGNHGCPEGYARLHRDSCCCTPSSPILIDVNGDGFDLTNASQGVVFDIFGNGSRRRFGWTKPGSDDAWLVLDRNNNGVIDNGTELFGNFTPQPIPPDGVGENGFLALAEYDKPSQGGNQDNQIDEQDEVFTTLRLWQDLNHNGVSEASELRSLKQLGLKLLELEYKTSDKADPHGNQFRYRAKVKDTKDAQLGRWAWDVFLVSQP